MSELDRAIALTERRWARRGIETRYIMVARYSGSHEGSSRRHVKMYHDVGGLYVRLGRRGVVKTYLKDMAGARIIDVERNLVVFHET